jgi:hypothetical protein
MRLKQSVLKRRNMFAENFFLRRYSKLECGYQCCYIRDYLMSNRFKNITPLGDYINEEHIGEFPVSGRKNTVLFNPKKGLEFTTKLIATAPDINWIALEGMSRSSLRKTIRSAKVYVDFGNHPGMDRLPRECAANGCCIITGRKGSAGYHDDVPIPDDCKFDEAAVSPKDVVTRIRTLLTNYDTEIARLEGYRAIISGQKAIFSRQVRALFTPGKGT